MWSESYQSILARVAEHPLCWVQVASTCGSAPREAGAWMAVFADTVFGTIGGGHLEWQAIDYARRLLASASDRSEAAAPVSQNYALGPSLGQCCGGAVVLSYACHGAGDQGLVQALLPMPSRCVALFGAGHVGHALVRILSGLPYRVVWVDSRDAVFPEDVAMGVQCEYSDPVQSAVHDLPAQSQVLIMSFSHAEDLEVVAQCLLRQRKQADLGFIGLIGSKTKWATFRHRLQDRGFSDAELAQVTCPIGIEGITGKEPEVIAVSVVAQLLQNLQH